MRIIKNPTNELHISPSSINTWKGCPRAWGYQYIKKIRRPSTRAQQLGTGVHKVLAQYLRTPMRLPDTKEGRVAKAGLIYLPRPGGNNLIVEQKFYMEDQGLLIQGVADCVDLDDRLVIDHKTTKDFKWMPTNKELESDPQAIIYTAYARALGLETPIRLRWVYYLTEGPSESRVINIPQGVPQWEDKWKDTLELAGLLLWIHAQQLDPNELPCNYESCGNYGGCHYINLCGGETPAERRRSKMENENGNETLEQRLERLKARKAQETGTGQVNPPQQQAAPTETPAAEQPTQQQLAEQPETAKPATQKEKREALTAAILELPTWEDKAVKNLGKKHGVRMTAKFKEQVATAYSQAQGPATNTEQKPDSIDKDTMDVIMLEVMELPELEDDKVRAIADQYKVVLLNHHKALLAEAWDKMHPEHAGQEGAYYCHCGNELSKIGKVWRCPAGHITSKPTRPKPAASAEQGDQKAPQTSAQPASEKSVPSTSNDKLQLFLWQDCLPTKLPSNLIVVRTGPNFLQQFQDEVAQMNNVEHYKLVEYAKGETEAALLLDRALKSGDIKGRMDLHVETYSTSKATLEILQRHAVQVVRGL